MEACLRTPLARQVGERHAGVALVVHVDVPDLEVCGMADGENKRKACGGQGGQQGLGGETGGDNGPADQPVVQELADGAPLVVGVGQAARG